MMKMKIATLVVMASLAITGCNFSKSVKKDLVSGLLTTGDGLSCDNVYLSVNDEKTERNTFIYGEEFLVNFNNIEGFKKENENVFPGMQLIIIGKTGDTVLQTNDLYSDYTDGMKLSPLLLTSDITVASPMKSKGEYTLNVNIWDKKGNGNFSAEFDFKVISNEQIVIEASNVSYDEIYLYSKVKDKVIPDNKIRFNEDTYVIFEGLSGFKEENGMVFPGFSLKATDNEGSMILDYNDLFADNSKSGLPASDFNARISSHFILSGSEFKNPLHCNFIIWDKKSDARITAKADLILE
jgi:predicted small secreted protein